MAGWVGCCGVRAGCLLSSQGAMVQLCAPSPTLCAPCRCRATGLRSSLTARLTCVSLPPCSHTIKTFGALLFATVMTTRQFISILLSCILFAHPLTGGQWLGTVMVFGESPVLASSCKLTACKLLCPVTPAACRLGAVVVGTA